MIIIKRSTPTVSRGITPHYDRKGKYSQKRIRESTILKSKVHLATSGSRVWSVTIFNTGLTKILVNLTNGSPFKKRFSNRPIKSPGSNFDSGYMNGNVIGSARSKDLTAWARGLQSRRPALPRSLRFSSLVSEKTSGIQGSIHLRSSTYFKNVVLW